MLNNVDLLLDSLLNQEGISKETKKALETPSLKLETSQYLISILNSTASDILSTNLTPNNVSANGDSIVEQIAELSNESTGLQKQITSILQDNWDPLLESYETLIKSYTNLNELALNTNKLNSSSNNNSNNNNKIDFNLQSGERDQNNGSIESNLYPLLKNIDTLISILELPALTNTLVKMTKYSECIEISSLMKRLSIRYNDISLISQGEINVNKEIQGMVQSLIRLINSNIKQSTIIKIVSLLKRITNNTSLLQQIFYKSRHQFIIQELDSLLPLLDSQLIERYLKRCIEVIREHCFQTIVTFESLFEPNVLLTSSFIESLVNHLCSLLNTHLIKIDDSSTRDSLLLQLVYCSQSLTRTGADFTSLIAKQLSPIMDWSSFWSIVQRQRDLVKSFDL